MMPFASDTVTLIRRTESKDAHNRTVVTYTRHTLTGCSWRRTNRIVRDGEALISSESITCRVPATQEKPKPGDLLILGDSDVTVTSGSEYQGLIEAAETSDGAFVVASVADNTRSGAPLPHYAARSV